MNNRRDRAGWIIGFAFALVLIAFPRSSVAVAIAAFVSLLGSAVVRRSLPRISAASGAIAALGALALASAFWSPVPFASVEKGSFLMVLALMAGAACFLVNAEPNRVTDRILVGMAAGLTFGAGLLAIELLTDEAIYRWVLTHLPFLRGDLAKHVSVQDGLVVRVSEHEINRRTAVVTALWLPAMVLIWRDGQGSAARWAWLASGILGLIAIAATASHQSSQLAIAAGAAAILLTRLIGPWAVRTVAVAWISVCLLMVPISLAAYRADLHKADWLFYTARHRIVIWSYMAQKVTEAPLLGRAAAATPHFHEKVEKSALEQYQRDAGVGVSLVPHAHNVFLQAWYELGAVGALSLLIAGLLCLRTIAMQKGTAMGLALAQFSATAALLSSSYGMWQFWLQALVAMGAVGICASIGRLSFRKPIE